MKNSNHLKETMNALITEKLAYADFLPCNIAEVFFNPLNQIDLVKEHVEKLHTFGIFFYGQILMFDQQEIETYKLNFPDIVLLVKNQQSKFKDCVDYKLHRQFYQKGARDFRWNSVKTVFATEKEQEVVAGFAEQVNVQIPFDATLRSHHYRELLKYREGELSLLYRKLHILRYFQWYKESILIKEVA